MLQLKYYLLLYRNDDKNVPDILDKLNINKKIKYTFKEDQKFMNINTIMNFIGWIFTILGLPSAIGFIHTKIKNRKNISWRKIMKQGIVALSKKVETI